MTAAFTRIRFILGALALLFVVAVAAPSFAQQPSPNNPRANSVQEEQLLNALRGGAIVGRITIPDTRSATLIQPEGRGWQEFHSGALRWIGAIVILGTLLVIVAFYLWRGMVKIQSGRSGRVIVRFNAFERFVHWMTATCFIILAISGLNITFGRPLFASTFGSEAFTIWSEWAKYAHNYLSFPFAIGVVLIFFMWIAGNIPNRVDVDWFKRGGGIVGDDHPPAYRFNGGQKAVYWIVVLGGAAVSISGYVLMFPFFGTDIATMQSAQMVHAIIAALFIAAMLGHIYIGTIGMEGAFEAMGTGTVDENWAREHHALWLAEEQGRAGANRTQRQPMTTPAE